jgi:hypothetical protein
MYVEGNQQQRTLSEMFLSVFLMCELFTLPDTFENSAKLNLKIVQGV